MSQFYEEHELTPARRRRPLLVALAFVVAGVAFAFVGSAIARWASGLTAIAQYWDGDQIVLTVEARSGYRPRAAGKARAMQAAGITLVGIGVVLLIYEIRRRFVKVLPQTGKVYD